MALSFRSYDALSLTRTSSSLSVDCGAAGEQTAGPLLPGGRDRRHHDRQRGVEAANQGCRDRHLTDRDGMDPEGSRRHLGQSEPEATAHGGQVVATTEQNEERPGDEEQEGRERLIEPPHEARKPSIIKSFQGLPVFDTRIDPAARN